MEFTRAELSAKIQWLIDIAGSHNVIEAVIHYFTKRGRNKIKLVKSDKQILKKNTLLFYSIDGETGHWIYIDRNGKEWNSYKLTHQHDGSNQFCQTFALIYMLADRGLKTMPKFVNRLEPKAWSNNICVAIDFWRWIFTAFFNNPLTNEWLINVFDELNKSYEIYNNTCKRSFHCMTLLPNNIDKHKINDLLDDILLYSDIIASGT